MTRARRTPAWLASARRLFPHSVWSGAGVIVRKKVFDSAVGSGTVPVDFVPVRVTGVVPTRWVLVVQDAAGDEHGVDVDRTVWEVHQVGDVVSADNPLIRVP